MPARLLRISGILLPEPTTLRGIFSKDTSWFIKFIFIFYLIGFVLGPFLSLFFLHHLPYWYETERMQSFNLLMGIMVISAIWFRWYRATLAIFVLHCLGHIVNIIIIEPSLFLAYSWVKTTNSVFDCIMTITGLIALIFMFFKSSGVRSYFERRFLDPNDMKEIGQLIGRILFHPYFLIVPMFLIITAKLILQFGFDEYFWSKDREGLQNIGYSEIEIFRDRERSISFVWKGDPVSYVKIDEKEKSDSDCNWKTTWTASSKKNKDNCLHSPVEYKQFDNACGKSTESTPMVKGRVYKVFISKSYDLTRGSGPPRGWASREFRY